MSLHRLQSCPYALLVSHRYLSEIASLHDVYRGKLTVVVLSADLEMDMVLSRVGLVLHSDS